MRVCVHAACNTLSTIGHDRFRDGFARLGALIFLTVSRACFPRGLIQLTPGEGSQVFTICSSIYIYIYKTVYKSEIRFNPMVEKNRNVEEYDIYGIYLHGYLRDFDSGEYRVCLRRISRRSLALEVEICPTSVFWSNGRLARFRSLDHGVVYGELELGTKFKRTLSPRANFRDTSDIRRIFISTIGF